MIHIDKTELKIFECLEKINNYSKGMTTKLATFLRRNKKWNLGMKLYGVDLPDDVEEIAKTIRDVEEYVMDLDKKKILQMGKVVGRFECVLALLHASKRKK